MSKINTFKINLKSKKNFFKKILSFIIWSWFILFAIFTIISFFESLGIIVLLFLYFRFALFLISVVLLTKILQSYNQQLLIKRAKLNYLTISLILLIWFNSFFPISFENDFKVNAFANLWLVISFFTSLIAYILNRRLISFIKDFKLNIYKSLFIGLGLIIFIPLKLIILFYNLIIQTRLIFRKNLNFSVSNFNRTKYIKHINFIEGDTNFNFSFF